MPMIIFIYMGAYLNKTFPIFLFSFTLIQINIKESLINQ